MPASASREPAQIGQTQRGFTERLLKVACGGAHHVLFVLVHQRFREPFGSYPQIFLISGDAVDKKTFWSLNACACWAWGQHASVTVHLTVESLFSDDMLVTNHDGMWILCDGLAATIATSMRHHSIRVKISRGRSSNARNGRSHLSRCTGVRRHSALDN